MSRGGPRPGAGRKSNPELAACHAQMDAAVTPDDWRAIYTRLVQIVKEGDPHAAIRAARLLIHQRWGDGARPQPEPEPEPDFEPIKLIEVRLAGTHHIRPKGDVGDPASPGQEGVDTDDWVTEDMVERREIKGWPNSGCRNGPHGIEHLPDADSAAPPSSVPSANVPPGSVLSANVPSGAATGSLPSGDEDTESDSSAAEPPAGPDSSRAVPAHLASKLTPERAAKRAKQGHKMYMRRLANLGTHR